MLMKQCCFCIDLRWGALSMAWLEIFLGFLKILNLSFNSLNEIQFRARNLKKYSSKTEEEISKLVERKYLDRHCFTE